MSTFDAQGNKHANAGKPGGGQFETQAKPETEASLGEPSPQDLVYDRGLERLAGRAAQFGPDTTRAVGSMAVEGSWLKELPPWPGTLPPPSEPDYAWDDNGQLETILTFGDQSITVWGVGEIEDSREFLDDLTDDEMRGVTHYARVFHENLEQATNSFTVAVHALPGVRSYLLDLARQGTEPAGAS